MNVDGQFGGLLGRPLSTVHWLPSSPKNSINWTETTSIINGMKIYRENIIWYLDKRILGRRISQCLWTKWKCYLLGIPPLGKGNFCDVHGVFCMSIHSHKPGLKCSLISRWYNGQCNGKWPTLDLRIVKLTWQFGNKNGISRSFDLHIIITMFFSIT